MDLKELMKLLVETDDKMERMRLIEENKELLEVAPATDQSGGEWEQKYKELEQKYIDTFFSGAATETPPTETEPPMEETITIDDLFKKGDDK